MNKKRFLSLLLALALILSGCSPAAQAPAPAPSEAESAVKAGIYKSTAEGFGGDIEVSLEVDESKIVKIEVSESETPTIGGAAIAQLKEDIVNKQSINLDTVSGATVQVQPFLRQCKMT